MLSTEDMESVLFNHKVPYQHIFTVYVSNSKQIPNIKRQ